MRGSEPGERRGGRQKGTLNTRTIAATDLLKQAQERFPAYNPLEALIALAEASEDVALKKDCHAALLPYYVPKFRPVVADPDALVDLEARIARARLEAQAEVLDEKPGLADRLLRAVTRHADDIEMLAATRPVVVDMTPEPKSNPAPQAEPAPALTSPKPAPSTVGDWERPQPLPPYSSPIAWAEKTVFADCDYENATDGLLNARLHD